MLTDLRFAWRQLWNRPGYTAVAVLTLALGIGANTAIFSLVNGLLLKPLPYPQPDRLMTLWERSPAQGIDQERVTGPDYLDWRAQNSVFAEMAVGPAWQGSEDFNLVLRDSTVKVTASYTSASFFTTLGTRPLLGRALLAEEDNREGNRVAVLGYRLWQRFFNGDTNVVGQKLTVDTYGRREYEIVGVMPMGFGVPGRAELWLPLGWMGVTLDKPRSAHWHHVIGRLKPGVTIPQAQRELNMIQARINQAHPGERIGSEVSVVPLLDQALGRNLRRALLILWAVVAGVLLIACANVANLSLARAATRQREMALRLALGAGRWRVMRQLLAENVLLAVLGGVAGIFLGWCGLHLFIAASPGDIPRLDEVALDRTVLVFTGLVSVLTGLMFGLAPAWQCSRADLNEALKESSHAASAGLSAGRTRNVLIVVEVALSVVLLTGAGLMLGSFARILRADRGFRPEHLITANLDFSVSGFTTWVQPTATRPQVPLRELLQRVRALPGVSSAGASSRLLRRENVPPTESIAIFGRTAFRPEDQPKAEFTAISPGWVHALGARILRGRDLTEVDTLQAPGAVLINETLARRYFPNQNPLGQRIKMGSTQPPLNATNVWGLGEWSEIVGVISDVKSLHPQPEAVPEVYPSYWQYPMQNPTLLIRTEGDPRALAQAIRRETKSVIPNLPSPLVRTMDTLVSETVAQPRLQTALLTLFGGLALLLAAVGLYGVLAYAVTQRQHEVGIRMALGARRPQVLSLIIGQGMRLVLAGIISGILGALALTRLLQSLLYGVTPTDPFTFSAVTILFLAVALFACWLPAQRAAKLDPMLALRHE